MELVIVTGMSGAGKSNAVNALEDLGFYCVDNLLPRFLKDFLQLCSEQPKKMERVALVIDVRGGEMLQDLEFSLQEVENSGYNYRLIFLDCKDSTIINRYKETRRKHPLVNEDCPTITQALEQERTLLKMARKRADYYIDTTYLKSGQLKGRVAALFSGRSTALAVHCMSFGFKYGIPYEADYMLDLRSLPNPFYVQELRPQTGLDKPVYDYVFGFEESQKLYDLLQQMADMLIELAEQEGRSQFTFALGCTGGQHRSVSFARRLGQHLQQKNINVLVHHRDIEK